MWTMGMLCWAAAIEPITVLVSPKKTAALYLCTSKWLYKFVIVDDTTDINKANDMLQGYNLIEKDKNTTYSIVKFEQPLVLKEAV